mmetsp:Transcript_30522/g.65773  ORF Transcript_30522/g.65773 Transcript_30522/m.65773 type:complete len:235 (-) Transcript_30522:383-1087(-)
MPAPRSQSKLHREIRGINFFRGPLAQHVPIQLHHVVIREGVQDRLSPEVGTPSQASRHGGLGPFEAWHPALRHLLHIVHKPKGAIFHKNASSVMLRFPPDGTMDGVVGFQHNHILRIEALRSINQALEKGPGVPAIIGRRAKNKGTALLFAQRGEVHTTITHDIDRRAGKELSQLADLEDHSGRICIDMQIEAILRIRRLSLETSIGLAERGQIAAICQLRMILLQHHFGVVER